MGINKVYFGNRILIDLTRDSVTKETLLRGKTAHDKTGTLITGTCRFDVDSSDADATANDILDGKTAYVKGNKLTGSMVNRGFVEHYLKQLYELYTLESGYYSGGQIGIDPDEANKLTQENIREGVEILGVVGSLKPSEITEFPPTMTFFDVIEDENGDPIVDQVEEALLGAYVYHKA